MDLKQKRAALAAALGQDAVPAALLALDGHDAQLAHRTLEPQADAEGFLAALTAQLAANLYPDAGHPARALSGEETRFLAVLETLFSFYDGAPDPLTDLLPVPEDAPADSRVAAEYDRFTACVRSFHIPALLRLTREAGVIDPASHIIGVHNLALHTAIFARRAGLAVDLPAS